MTETIFDTKRRAMVATQLRTTAVNDPRVVAAMGVVPREAFVPPDRQAAAYADRAVPLANGRALVEPMVTGRLLTEARVKASDRVLVIGAAGGYAAAVAALLAPQVIALEEDAALPPVATADVERASGPLAEGWAAGAPYDVILFDGAVAKVPPAIVAQLADGGRIAVPLLHEGIARLSIGVRAGDGFGLTAFAEADVPALPGFAQPRAFTF